jgi:hypothetical protein
MRDTTCCIFCEYGDHEHPAYDAMVMRCGCACHGRTTSIWWRVLRFFSHRVGTLGPLTKTR